MNKIFLKIILCTIVVLSPLMFKPLNATLTGNEREKISGASDFTLIDITGKYHTLSEYKGKIILLEWTNPNCGFVKRHYESGRMQKLQKTFTEKGVVWLAINSTNPQHKEFLSSEALLEKYTEWKPFFSANLIDAEGLVGKQYGARTTPHIFVIDSEFNLVYQGSVDNDPRGGNEERTVFVAQVLDALLAGKTPDITSTQPYGCSVKYGN